MSADVISPIWANAYSRVIAGSPELVARNGHLLVAFDAAAVETTEYQLLVAPGYDSGSSVTCTVTLFAATATSGNVRVRLAFESTTTDIDSDSFATAVEANAAADGTSGVAFTASFTLSNSDLDSVAAGGKLRMQLTRVGNDGTNDTMTGDAQFLCVTFTQ